jgi:hypothetical protein
MTTNKLDPVEIAAAIEGWKRYHTGGGCMALRFDVESPPEDRAEYLCTYGDDGSYLPTWGASILVGKYDLDERSEELAMWTFTFDGDAEGLDCYGIVIDGMRITDPFASGCGRFVVDPTEAYGLPMPVARLLAILNGEGRSLAEDHDTALIDCAIDAMFAHVQEAIGVTDGGFAGMLFQGTTLEDTLRGFLRDYIKAERAAR